MDAHDKGRLAYLETHCEETSGRMGPELADELDVLRRLRDGEQGISYRITMKWVPESEDPADIEADLFNFRNAHPGVEFTPDPDWASGPGSDQWPRVRVTSANLGAIQAAIREIAMGPVTGISNVTEVWEISFVTGIIESASLGWTRLDGAKLGSDVINAEP